MTTTLETSPPRRLWRSLGAVLAGFATVVVLSTAADEVMYATGIFPPRTVVMQDPALYLLALVYRCAFGVAGSWVAARLAPGRPMRHALIVGAIGLALSALGLVVMAGKDLGPTWYPVALVVLTLPCAWLGGALGRSRRPSP